MEVRNKKTSICWMFVDYVINRFLGWGRDSRDEFEMNKALYPELRDEQLEELWEACQKFEEILRQIGFDEVELSPEQVKKSLEGSMTPEEFKRFLETRVKPALDKVDKSRGR